MARFRGWAPALAVLTVLAGCTPSYSPDTYASNAAQQANKVEQGIVVGVRPVAISASGVVGAATGGAAGGVIGAQAGPGGISSALGAVGGTLVGGLVGTTVEHAQGDTTGWEYIVKETKGDLVSVTQKDDKPLAIGQKVLVIAGNQARVVPDYTETPPPPTTTAPPPAPVTETPLALPPGATPATPPAPAAISPPPSAAPSSSAAPEKPVAPATLPAALNAIPPAIAAPLATPSATPSPTPSATPSPNPPATTSVVGPAPAAVPATP
jgi:outer membrane lipoprotein SlyB